MDSNIAVDKIKNRKKGSMDSLNGGKSHLSVKAREGNDNVNSAEANRNCGQEKVHGKANCVSELYGDEKFQAIWKYRQSRGWKLSSEL